MEIPFLSFKEMHAPLREEMKSAFEQVYDGYWYIMGEALTRFEKEYAEFNGVGHAIGVSNGLDALFLALKTLSIGAGDEVIVPSNTYIATLLAVSYTGATPVLAEPDPATYNINPNRIADAITSRTRAVMPVHLYGQACDMAGIDAVAKKAGLFVIEDNAQAHGARFDGRMTGSWGHINGTSFYPGKNLGALGDAGAVTTDDDHLAAKARILRNYGSAKKYFNEVIGHNMRLDELQAAFLSVKLKKLMEWTAQRQELAAMYDGHLSGLGDLVLPVCHPQATHVYHLYVVRSQRRDELQSFLNREGIGTMIHYPVPPHQQKAYESLGLSKGVFPIAEEIAKTCLSLPLWPGMSQEMIARVAETIKRFFKS